MAFLPLQGEPLSIGKDHDYTVTITIHGTDLDDCANLMVIFADKIRERVQHEEGSIGMAEGEYTVEGLPEEEAEDEPIGQELLSPKVTASCHTDDYRVAVEEFDATLWFATADDEDIQRLRDDGWCNSSTADTVAEDAAEENTRIAEMFTYLDIVNGDQRGGDSVGFECEVNEEEALEWVKQHRPHLSAQWFLEEEGEGDEP